MTKHTRKYQYFHPKLNRKARKREELGESGIYKKLREDFKEFGPVSLELYYD